MALRPADYHEAVAFGRELSLFANSWVPACRSEEIVGANVQKRVAVATTEVLLTRDGAGALHAVSNVCRHRGSLLVDDTAEGAAIRCPYHLWTYALDGKLRSAPFMDGVSLDGCDLPRYAVTEWGGFVFVNLDGKAGPLALPPALRDVGPMLASWTAGFRIPFEHAWNWKVMVENFAESYHHIAAHAQTLQPIWPGGESDASASTRQWIELRHSRHPQAGTFTVYVVFPFFLLAVSDPGETAYWYRMVPKGPERIALEIVGLMPKGRADDAAEVEALRGQLMAIHLEDIPVCERTQAGLRSADAVLGPLSKLEAGLGEFRKWLQG